MRGRRDTAVWQSEEWKRLQFRDEKIETEDAQARL
jgi:hypothetical protein